MKESERLAGLTDAELIDEASAIEKEQRFYYRAIMTVLLIDFIYSVFRIVEEICRIRKERNTHAN